MVRMTVNGVALAVREWPGKGPALVCVHGLTANHSCWASMADALAPDFRLIGYDLRGRGESGKPESGYSLEHHCKDLLGLLDAFGLRKAVIMGHSLGAHIGLRFAALHPARVSKLVLVDVPGAPQTQLRVAAVGVPRVDMEVTPESPETRQRLGRGEPIAVRGEISANN